MAAKNGMQCNLELVHRAGNTCSLDLEDVGESYSCSHSGGFGSSCFSAARVGEV